MRRSLQTCVWRYCLYLIKSLKKALDLAQGCFERRLSGKACRQNSAGTQSTAGTTTSGGLDRSNMYPACRTHERNAGRLRAMVGYAAGLKCRPSWILLLLLFIHYTTAQGKGCYTKPELGATAQLATFLGREWCVIPWHTPFSWQTM